jgi:Fe2+ transport system protein FeoA
MDQNNKGFIALRNASKSGFYQIAEIRNRLLALKLMEMGCLKGMIIQKISAAPFNGPIVIRVYPNENLLALRYEEATDIMISEPDSNRV